MNKKGSGGRVNFWGISIIMVIIITIVFVFYYVYKGESTMRNECLVKIAKEVCKERGWFYKGVSWNFRPIFYCQKDERKGDYFGDELKFLLEELKRCEK